VRRLARRLHAGPHQSFPGIHQRFVALFALVSEGAAGSPECRRAWTVPLQVYYAGAQSTYPGLDQINVLLDRKTHRGGLLTLQLKVDGVPANLVILNIQ